MNTKISLYCLVVFAVVVVTFALPTSSTQEAKLIKGETVFDEGYRYDEGDKYDEGGGALDDKRFVVSSVNTDETEYDDDDYERILKARKGSKSSSKYSVPSSSSSYYSSWVAAALIGNSNVSPSSLTKPSSEKSSRSKSSKSSGEGKGGDEHFYNGSGISYFSSTKSSKASKSSSSSSFSSTKSSKSSKSSNKSSSSSPAPSACPDFDDNDDEPSTSTSSPSSNPTSSLNPTSLSQQPSSVTASSSIPPSSVPSMVPTCVIVVDETTMYPSKIPSNTPTVDDDSSSSSEEPTTTPDDGNNEPTTNEPSTTTEPTTLLEPTTEEPTINNEEEPTTAPPSDIPSFVPSTISSAIPSENPSEFPTGETTTNATEQQPSTTEPTSLEPTTTTDGPSMLPSEFPSFVPTTSSSAFPSENPTDIESTVRMFQEDVQMTLEGITSPMDEKMTDEWIQITKTFTEESFHQSSSSFMMKSLQTDITVKNTFVITGRRYHHRRAMQEEEEEENKMVEYERDFIQRHRGMMPKSSSSSLMIVYDQIFTYQMSSSSSTNNPPEEESFLAVEPFKSQSERDMYMSRLKGQGDGSSDFVNLTGVDVILLLPSTTPPTKEEESELQETGTEGIGGGDRLSAGGITGIVLACLAAAIGLCCLGGLFLKLGVQKEESPPNRFASVGGNEGIGVSKIQTSMLTNSRRTYVATRNWIDDTNMPNLLLSIDAEHWFGVVRQTFQKAINQVISSNTNQKTACRKDDDDETVVSIGEFEADQNCLLSPSSRNIVLGDEFEDELSFPPPLLPLSPSVVVTTHDLSSDDDVQNSRSSIPSDEDSRTGQAFL